MLSRCVIVVTVTLIILAIWLSLPLKPPTLSSAQAGQRVMNYIVGVEIPDLPERFAEGGFYLYHEAPFLNSKKLMANNFDKGSVVKHYVDLSHKLVTLDQLVQTLPEMSIYSNSTNKFNASKIFIFGVLGDGQGFYGHKYVDPYLNMDASSNPIDFSGTLIRLGQPDQYLK